MSWHGLAAIFIAAIAVLFVACVIWRKTTEAMPSAAYWSFSVLLGLMFTLFAVPELLQQLEGYGLFVGGKEYAVTKRTQDTNKDAILAAVADLAARIDNEKRHPEPRWILFGEAGDCPATDIAQTPGATPDDSKCTTESAKTSAVCWDGAVYQNGTKAFCTYKTTPPEQCRGGARPGRIYRCQPG
jgi:hypothetical protein